MKSQRMQIVLKRDFTVKIFIMQISALNMGKQMSSKVDATFPLFPWFII